MLFFILHNDFIRQTKFASLPEVLVVHAKKFQLVNWVPAKLGACFFHLVLFAVLFTFISTDIPVILPPEDELVFTDRHLGQGLQASETELPNESAGKQAVGHSSFSKLIFCFIKFSFVPSSIQRSCFGSTRSDGIPNYSLSKSIVSNRQSRS
jgi:hypothetical protein